MSAMTNCKQWSAALVHLAVFILQFSLFNFPAWAAPTLSRLSFYVPPDRMAEFEAAYEAKVVPILRRHGLVASSERGRAAPEGVFSRLFELRAPSEVEEKQKALQADPAFREVMRTLKTSFGTAQSAGGMYGPISQGWLGSQSWLGLRAAFSTPWPSDWLRGSFGVYATPAGPGERVPAGDGAGHWRTYDATDGLASVHVHAIFQDREGHIWFGTQGGVSRYDGQGFVNLTTKDGLADNLVRSILQDREGHLWFGTNAGASRYDGKTWTTFTTRDGLAGNAVLSTFQDREGYLWFGTNAGVSRYDGRTFTTFTTKDGLADDWVYAICQDREGHLWFGTNAGISRYDGRTLTPFTPREGLPSNYVYAISQDREGHLWFGTNAGLSRYDGRSFTTFTTKDGLADDWVYAILQDREGDLWFGTLGGGVSRGAPSASPGPAASERARRKFLTLTTRDGLAGNAVKSIFQDREGHLWFGTTAGVSRYAGRTFTTFTAKDGLVNEEAFSILQDREGNFWFGTYGGVSRYDGRTFTTFTTKDGLASNNVLSIFQDREGNFWFGTYGGVSRYDGRTFTTFTTEDGLSHNAVRVILQDREEHLWFGTYGGVSRYDGKTFTAFTARDGLSNNWVFAILQDRKGDLWFGTYGGGVSRYDGRTFTTFTTKQGLANDRIYSIAQDREGNLWFGTHGGGVSRYDGRIFTTFTTKQGLASDYLLSPSLQDREGHLWFGTHGGGASRYDGREFQALTRQDGLAGDLVRAILQDRNGDLWFGMSGGVTRYRPPAPSPPPVFIDAVMADQRYEKVSELAIPSGVGLTTFEFHGMSFKTRPEAMVYRYRLKGYDKEWRNTHARRVEYQDLPIGTYTFEVQAVDRDLVYSKTPATVTLKVHLPYERIGLLSALGIAFALVAWQTGRVVVRDRRLRQANEDLRREMDERQRAEEERKRAEQEGAKLDERLQQLGYLYRLREALGAARSSDEVFHRAGEALMEVLSPSTSAGVLIECDGRAWGFGEADPLPALPLKGEEAIFPPFTGGSRGGFPLPAERSQGGPHSPLTAHRSPMRYERPLSWGGKHRGSLSLFCGVELSESQERMLLDETAGQIAAALEAKELETQILHSARLVSLGQMAAGVAHELNQPLGAISATAEDLYLRVGEGREVSQEQLKEMMQDVLGLVDRMTGTIEHLRVFSRDTSKEPGFPFSVNEVVHSSLRLIEAQLKSHGIAVHLDLAEGLPFVLGRPHQLEQVFLNLLSNARDALDEKEQRVDRGSWIVDRPPLLSPCGRGEAPPVVPPWTGEQDSLPVHGEGRVGDESRITNHESRGWEKRVWVRTRRERDEVVAEVEDNGTGMDEADRARLFEPFFTTKEADRGTGLGLSISYAIVRDHGGRIACESRKGEGTVFRVALPASEA